MKEMFFSNIKFSASRSVKPTNSLSEFKLILSVSKENSLLVTPLEKVALTPGSGLNGEREAFEILAFMIITSSGMSYLPYICGDLVFETNNCTVIIYSIIAWSNLVLEQGPDSKQALLCFVFMTGVFY